uniref:quinone oxidoreductase family protein n=1 Tax=Pararhizobium sp. IMCC3301 TaxID=3067904 RepID=UPI002741E80C|nr:quinone oxidoreductase [Pararhizobium sp. IMCC3301]
MTKAIVIRETGGPEVLNYESIEVAEPNQGEALVRHTAIGLNFIDVYFRSGLYPPPNGMPFIPGNEGAGIVEAVGAGVTHVKAGDRVAYVGPLGSYAERRIVPADRLVSVPQDIADKTAAAMMMKGMTAQYLLCRTFKVGEGHTILFHAASGGVGLIACQWAKALGATVIGTVGSDEKAELAKAHGVHHTINYREEDFVARIQDITGGRGVDVVYDSVGQDTYPGSLDCLKPLGMWVSFGQSSGPITNFNLSDLAQRGSLFATRPTLFNYVARRQDLEQSANDLFNVVSSGRVKIPLHQEFPLAEAGKAHEALEGRKTTGTSILTV